MCIDIVVPIYNAYHELSNCLKSLECNQNKANNIILINDASTDKRIVPLIEEIAEKNNWVVIENEKNLGFVKTANKGLKMNDNHTILLNSDTVVTHYWLEAFANSIKRVKNLGTATAWSNNAEICSFPLFLKNNNVFNDRDGFSEVLFKKYKANYPEIPTAVGFCMLITKAAKQKVGYFDEKHFGHGYGEENDYSQRVKIAGLKNILCDNAYVVHEGNASFSDFGVQPSEESMQRLLKLHPNYLKEIQKYIALDPLAEVRKKITSIVHTYDRKLYEEIISQ